MRPRRRLHHPGLIVGDSDDIVALDLLPYRRIWSRPAAIIGAESPHDVEPLKGDVQVSWSAADAAIKALYRALTRAHNLLSRHC